MLSMWGRYAILKQCDVHGVSCERKRHYSSVIQARNSSSMSRMWKMVRKSYSITTGELTLFKRKGATKSWLKLELESQELLALCLKKVKNLGTSKGARLIDAKFLYREEHSKRLLVKMTVESMDAAVRRDTIRQTCECEFIIETQMW